MLKSPPFTDKLEIVDQTNVANHKHKVILNIKP
ncbi:MAG: hypothetical protein QT11_C0001G0194 [archaeon GW2011_AR20]|nr:MAG: hypothetical protein QT11_C0001G0194 [archaeon GW2011_AR20]